ncbi:MAG: hypothetical protein AB7O24_05660 [Kofleriaceae bacterium]
MPALFAHIPADTPYLMGALEPFPLEYYQHLQDATRPLTRGTFERHGGTMMTILRALEDEVAGNWTYEGFAKLGFADKPRFAVYGLGLLPVGRIEVGDEKVMVATISRLLAKVGWTTAPETRNGATLWRFERGDSTVFVAVTNGQLVISYAPSAVASLTLGHVLGTDRPTNNLADGAALKQVMTKHGFGPSFLAYADARLLIAKVAELMPSTTPPSCQAELRTLAERVPRFAMGYTELTRHRASFGTVFELAPDLLADLKALKAPAPGLDVVLSGDPIFGFGGAANETAARALVSRFGTVLVGIGRACNTQELGDVGEQVKRAAATPLPVPVSGVAMALHALSKQPGEAMPDRIEAIGLATGTSGKQILDSAMRLVPMGSSLGIVADGKLNQLKPMMPIPFDVYAGVSERSVVIAVGDRDRALAEKAMAAKDTSPVPLLTMTYDYQKFVELQRMFDDDDDDDDDGDKTAEREASIEMMKHFGRADLTVDVSTYGVGFWMSLEMK